MAIYILVLSAVPCSDAHNDCNDSKAKTELAQDHEHQQDHDDTCSPFCTCACCGVSIINMNFTPLQVKTNIVFALVQKVTICNSSLISNFFGSIWQPPKIVSIC